jgi:hypothetical protein
MPESNDRWGHCMNCNHFSSPAREPLEDEESACSHPVLAKVQLRVFGSCGCNNFAPRSVVVVRKRPAAVRT